LNPLSRIPQLAGPRFDACRARDQTMPQTYTVGARSLFVTTTAWLFIVLAALASVAALVQNAGVASLMPSLQVSTGQAQLPLLTGLLLGYLPWVVGAGFAMSLGTLASSIGLLMRLDWARRSVIGLLAFAIVVNLLGLWLQQEVMQSVVSSTLRSVAIPPQALGVFGGFVTAARVLAVLMSLAGCGVLVWIIRRLMSAGVRQEFA
jgi:hypothetical protein